MKRAGPRAPKRARVPVHLQSTVTECGVACLAMLASHHGRWTELRELRQVIDVGRDGASALDLVRLARELGFEAKAYRTDPEHLGELPSPFIAHWNLRHYVVVERRVHGGYRIVDPASGRRVVSDQELDRSFTGVALTLVPTTAVERRPRVRVGFLDFVTPFLPKSFWHVAAILGASLALVLFALVPAAVTALVVDRVLPAAEESIVTLLAAGAIVFTAGHLTMSMMRAELLLWLQMSIDRSMMQGFMQHLMALPYKYFQLRRTGDLLVRVSSMAHVRDVLSGQFLALALDVGMIAVYLGIIATQSLPFAGAILGLGAVQITVMAASARRAQHLAERELVAMSDAQSVLLESINAVESVKSSGAEEHVIARWADRFVRQLDASVDRRRLDSMVAALLEAVRTVTPVLMILLGAVLVMNGGLTLGQMLGIVALATAALAPVGQLGANLQGLQTVRVHLQRLRDVFDEEPERRPNAALTPTISGAIELRNVSFRYSGSGPLALHDVSVRIEPGEKIAIVGESGSGKSTLARVLLGLLRPSHGHVLFDAIALDDLDLAALRRQCGVVTQESHLVSGSIRENIALAAPQASAAEIEQAATTAGLHDDICEMPMGYETMLGESGLGLSGGQLQRLSLARALVHQPRILLLDEATSHLDALTEETVNRNLERVEATRIVIAHRLSTVQDADRIVVMDRGRIAEVGTHHELLARRSKYADLLSSQLAPPTHQLT